jgi:DNA ligase (NAD+)
MGITKVIDIKWQVGNSGRITPVASVEPIEVGGVTITSISLHNLAMFKELALFQGCRVLISRRNDVIPYIEQNLDIREAA